MLFSSFTFIFGFLPLTWLAWRWLAGRNLTWALGWLVLASLVFYSWWDPRYLPLLLGSVAINFLLGGRILSVRRMGRDAAAARWMAVGITFNLLALGYFKYAHFLSITLSGVIGQNWTLPAHVLPLAISFVTFQKIAYLVDCRRGLVHQHRLRDYLFFVTFFPQLIAGPIVHHQPLIAQLSPGNPLLHDHRIWQSGLGLFAIGLFKKVVLADSLGHYAGPVFAAAAAGPVSGEAAWSGMLAYTLQLYFDFSGYSDMAIGLGLLFGFRLPLNFQSPYRADSIIEFWRRWHMTLSAFLRDYVYIPLGGGRAGSARRYRNLLLTMLLGGVWHGAGWTFVLWGVMHGVLLLLNHAWRAVSVHLPRPASPRWGTAARMLGVGMTFLLVALAWVLFRAPDLATAWHLYLSLLQTWLPVFPEGDVVEAMLALSPSAVWLWLLAGLLVVWGLPNAARFMRYDPVPNASVTHMPGLAVGLVCGVLLWCALKWLLTAPTGDFLYFNF